jgi:hypothetical protein
LPKPKNYAYPFPDLLTFNDAPTPIEQQLFVMYLEHRMRAFQGTFHANPDYAFGMDGTKCNATLWRLKPQPRRCGESQNGDEVGF